MSLTYAGLTLYAVLSGIEEDLRDVIRTHLVDHKSGGDLLGEDLWKNSVSRLERDIGFADDRVSVNDVLAYLDFADAYQVINSNHKLLPNSIANYVRRLTPSFEKLVPVRNRVAHSRPLNFEDFPTTMDIAGELVKIDGMWDNLRANLDRLNDEPSFVLGLKLPAYERSPKDQRHNLPIPEFNDTGFLGREKQLDDVIKRCLSPQYPVITLVGEGGIGKTALAQKVAYNILDRDNCPFDAVVWTTSKTTQITAKEIVALKGAISTSLGMLQDVVDSLAPKGSENPAADILEYLGAFPILLILDNLETVLDDRISEFLTEIPQGSKVLITSRIGLGNAEFRVKLTPMNDQETLQLLRRMAQIQGVQEIAKAENRRLLKYCNKMSNNPGFIKWFVAAVKSGSRPEEVLEHSHIFYDFCMSNIYSYLNEESRTVLKSMQYLPGRHSQAKLAYLNDMEARDLERALHELLRTNMVTMTSVLRGSTYESQYELSELAFGYLRKHHPLKPDELRKFEKVRRLLAEVTRQLLSAGSHTSYSLFSIVPRSVDDYILVKYLSDSLNEAYSGRFDAAKKLVTKARQLAPEYYEVHRVEANVQELQGNVPAARDAFEAAIDLAPQSAPLRVWYGAFLSKHLEDNDAALEQIVEASKLDPESVDVKLNLARVLLYAQRFEESKHLLDEIKAQAAKRYTPEWIQRKIYDVRLQYFEKKGEELCLGHNPSEALKSLQNLKREFSECPPALIDSRMKETLRRAARTTTNCVEEIGDKAGKLRAMRLAGWMSNK